MTQPDMASLIDRLGQTAKECRELIKDMHAAQKDLGMVIRESKDAGRVLREVIDETLDEYIGDEIAKYIDAKILAGIKELTAANDAIMAGLSRHSTEMVQALQETVDRMAELNSRYAKKVEDA